jgi:hypothetical protein
MRHLAFHARLIELALQAGNAAGNAIKVPCTSFRISSVLTAEDASPCAAVQAAGLDPGPSVLAVTFCRRGSDGLCDSGL